MVPGASFRPFRNSKTNTHCGSSKFPVRRFESTCSVRGMLVCMYICHRVCTNCTYCIREDQKVPRRRQFGGPATSTTGSSETTGEARHTLQGHGVGRACMTYQVSGMGVSWYPSGCLVAVGIAVVVAPSVEVWGTGLNLTPHSVGTKYRCVMEVGRFRKSQARGNGSPAGRKKNGKIKRGNSFAIFKVAPRRNAYWIAMMLLRVSRTPAV